MAFNKISAPFRKKSAFDLSHSRKFSCDMGYLVPFFVEDIVPGDKFVGKTDMLVRLAPQLAPIMHNVDVYTHYWFVPNRLLWKNWENFITGGKDGKDASVPPYLQFSGGTVATGTLADYIGIPQNIGTNKVSALPFRAYNLIYNEWYRDQNLIDEASIGLEDGLDTTTNLDLHKRCWEKDYFTSALPWPQRGESVRLPLGSTAPVVSDGTSVMFHENGGVGSSLYTTDAVGGSRNIGLAPAPGANLSLQAGDATGANTGYEADLSEATASTVNDIRLAFQLQRWFERNARAGARYVESILSHFGVRSSDARLQRPEYIGGGRSPIIFSEVLQTSSTDGTSPQGNMSGHAFSAHKSHTFKKFFEEHGWLIGIVSIMPRTAYQQGLPRRFSRDSRFDYFWPEFQNLGEQAVLKKELYSNSSDPDGVFGYQGRYEELRHRESSVHGDFKTNLDYWHMGRIFDNEPTLSKEFVECDATKRISAVQGEHNCWIDLYNFVTAYRPIIKRAEPGFIDHN